MKTFWAIRPHDAGFFKADYVRVTGYTRDEVLLAARSGMVGGRYLSQIVADDRVTTLWTESGGWTEAAATILPS